MSIATKIKTQYTLRAYQDSDLHDLFHLLSNQEVNLYLPWFVHNSVIETKYYINEVHKNQDYYYVIEDNEKQQVIGYISLSHIDEWHVYGEVEYALLKEYWGHNIICSIFDEFIMQIKKQHFKYIYVKNNQNNRRSERVLEKIGMVYSSESHELWKPKNIPVTFKCYKLNLEDYAYFLIKNKKQKIYEQN